MIERKIYRGKVEDVLPSFPNCFADLVVADPPFNKSKKYDNYDDNLEEETYLNLSEIWIREGFRILKSTGTFWMYCPTQWLGDFQVIGKRYGIWQNTICWHYTNPTPQQKRFPKTWSAWLFFSKSQNFKFFPKFEKSIESFHTNRQIGTKEGSGIYDVWSDISKLTGGYLAQREVVLKPNTNQRMFVYQLPLALLRRIIGFCTEKEDLVVDLFSHSGTTSIAAQLMGRNWIAIEQSELYCKEIEKRISKMSFGILKND